MKDYLLYLYDNVHSDGLHTIHAFVSSNEKCNKIGNENAA